MDIDEWEVETSSGVGDDASTSDVETSDSSEGAGPAEGQPEDYVESGRECADVKVIIEEEDDDSMWDAETVRRYESLTPPP